jgi:hypothetical protein
MEELSGLEFRKEKDVRDFTAGKISGYPARTCVQGSDAHSLSKFGELFTYLKMDGVSLRGLQQALMDHEVRIRFQWDTPLTPTHPRLSRMTVSQGFFGGVAFDFHPNLNCLIGGKGTGKSTVIEFMRYCFADISTIEDIEEDTNGKISTLLGEGGAIQVEYLDSDGELKFIKREFQGWETSRAVKDSGGNPTSIQSPPVFFSQGELTRIASSPIAQIELLDRYINLNEENNAETRICGELRTLAAVIQELRNENAQLLEVLEDEESGLMATKENYEALAKTLKTAIFSEFPKWESESRYISGFREGLGKLLISFNEAIDSIDADQDFPAKPDSDSPNSELLVFVSELGESLKEVLLKAKKDFASVIGQKLEDLDDLVIDWQQKFEAKKEEYDRSLEELGELDLRKAQARLRTQRARLDQLEEKKKKQDATKAQIQKEFEKRAELLGQLNKARERRYKKRADKAKQWENLLGGKIRVQIAASSGRRDYLDALKALSRGAKLRETDLKLVADKLHPNTFVEGILQGDPNILSEWTGLKSESCEKLINVLQSHDLAELLELDCIPLPDRPELSYEVEPGRFKALQELSVGGKGTVIISLALIEGQMPLIIDQPEEPLDTLAIHEEVVGTLRRHKDSRQFVFTTHNPNVAVGGDAELSHVLQASADRGSIRSSGGLDQTETNKLLLHHLEGGGIAFDLRARKYIR